MKKLLYWSEIWIAPILSVLLVSLNLTPLSPILFVLGATTTTLVEYIVHAWLLHGLRVKQHLEHHRRPDERIYTVYWPLWVAMVPTLLVPAFGAGILAGYAYYLFVHHSAHHDRRWLSTRLLAHHDGHHSMANKNFGVSTIMWDILFRTRK